MILSQCYYKSSIEFELETRRGRKIRYRIVQFNFKPNPQIRSKFGLKLFLFKQDKIWPKQWRVIYLKCWGIFLGDILGLNFLSEFLKKVLNLFFRILIY